MHEASTKKWGVGESVTQKARKLRKGALRLKSEENLIDNLPENIDKLSDLELAVWYNDNVIYPDKVCKNCYYYHHYSFIKDIQMIPCIVLGKKMKYAGEDEGLLVNG